VGLDADMIRRYVRYQERKERQLEQLQLINRTINVAQPHSHYPLDFFEDYIV
jgi:hypothetical protein